MRGLWAASAAIVLSIPFGGLPVVAQDGATWISGSVTCEVSDWGTESQEGGVASIRDRLATCAVAASDPRASGSGPHVYNEDCRSASCIDWGTYEVIGADGSWSGPWTGIEITRWDPRGVQRPDRRRRLRWLNSSSPRTSATARPGPSRSRASCTRGRRHPSDSCRQRRASSPSHPPVVARPARGGPHLLSPRDGPGREAQFTRTHPRAARPGCPTADDGRSAAGRRRWPPRPRRRRPRPRWPRAPSRRAGPRSCRSRATRSRPRGPRSTSMVTRMGETTRPRTAEAAVVVVVTRRLP